MAGGRLEDGWRKVGGWLEDDWSVGRNPVPLFLKREELGLESAISFISSLRKKSIELTVLSGGRTGKD